MQQPCASVSASPSAPWDWRVFRPSGPCGFPAWALSPSALWLEGRVRWRLARFSLFNRRQYRKQFPGLVSRLLPLTHFLRRGMYRDTAVATPEFFAATLGPRWQVTPPDTRQADPLAPPRETIGVYASSLGNAFMAEIADDLAESLRAAGARVIRADEHAKRSARPEVTVFVAPHEFFTLGQGPRWARPGILRRAVIYGTEQVHTPWFWRGLAYGLAARGVLDLSWHTANLLGEVMPSLHQPPGLTVAPWTAPAEVLAHPLLRGAWWLGEGRIDPRDDLDARPLDVVFFGGDSPRRDRFFARYAARFAAYDCLLYLRKRGRGPIHPHNVEGNLAPCARLACGRAKITLSIHREAFGYFEWHRLVRQAMASGSLAVTETGCPVPDFRAGEHYLCEDADHLPQLLDWLLRTPDGRAQAKRCRDNALALLERRCRPETAGARILAFLQRLGLVHATPA